MRQHTARNAMLAFILAIIGLCVSTAEAQVNPNVCNCNAVVFNPNKAKTLLTNQCYTPAEAIDGITDIENNGWGAMRGSTGGSPIAVFPLAQLTPTNGLTIFSNVSSENALTDFTVEYTTDKSPKIRASQWKPFPAMQAIVDELFCVVDGARVHCARPQTYICLGWEQKTITALRITVEKPKKFLITELTLRSC